MPKDQVAHYRPSLDWETVACSPKIKISDVLFTMDPRDVRCNNCLRTDRHKADLAKRLAK